MMVLSSDLANVLRPWVIEHTRPNQSGMEDLAHAAGFNDASLVRRLMNGKGNPYTTLAVADRLLAAADMTEALQDTSLKVIQNPQHTKWPEKMRAQGIEPEELLS